VTEIKRFEDGMRVRVNVDYYDRIVGAVGVVVRLRRADLAAWIELETRQADELHPFPADDALGRATHVLAWPNDCERIVDP
jgi:hypothetical protein